MAKGKQLCLSFLGEILTHWYKFQIQYINWSKDVFYIYLYISLSDYINA
jgi:hypothetical protein